MLQTSETGEGIFNKLKGSVDKARCMGSRVVPHFGPNNDRHAQVRPKEILASDLLPQQVTMSIHVHVPFVFWKEYRIGQTDFIYMWLAAFLCI